MRIAAVCAEDGTIATHFREAKWVRLYDAEEEEEEILSSEEIEVKGSLPLLLAEHETEVLLVNGINPEVLIDLARYSIEVLPGAQGEADKAVKAYLRGDLEQDGIGVVSDCSSCGEEGECTGDCSHCHPFGGLV